MVSKRKKKRALTDYKSNDNEYIKKLAFLAYKSDTYQVRMYGAFLFGYLSEQDDILAFMRDEVSKDDNWRVQEVLAKAFDEFCKKKGYEKALPIIDEWLRNNNANTRRAVTEGLRIWTSRAYFKDNPNEAIRRIASLKEDTSDYVRKSVGNALRDISKKFPELPELIEAELNNWNLESKGINQVYKLASKFIRARSGSKFKWQRFFNAYCPACFCTSACCRFYSTNKNSKTILRAYSRASPFRIGMYCVY